jgi:hypothetical protein
MRMHDLAAPAYHHPGDRIELIAKLFSMTSDVVVGGPWRDGPLHRKMSIDPGHVLPFVIHALDCNVYLREI